MKRSLVVACLGVVLVALAAPASAELYLDTIWDPVKLNESHPDYSYTHTLGGYNSGDTIYWAGITISLSDDSLLDADELVNISLNDSTIATAFEVDYLGFSAWVAADLLENGSLKVTLQRTEGDFWFLGSSLLAEGGPTPVPGPATLVLLGVGLLGIAVIAPRRYRRK